MLPNPLHPAVVHFPVVLAFLLPLFAIGAIWTIRRGTRMRAAWSVPLAMAVALTASAWVAVQTGESQDERIEQVVAEQPLETHEEMAETFMTASAVLAVIAAAGLIGGIAGKTARALTAVGAVVLVVGAARVGHSGGELVYKHGAASAYARADSGAISTTQAGGEVERRGDDDDDER
ncbi:MAG TPA: DUF2231 domain-containing protein [Gemmatimonadaceae bacterium]|nr:DUF2231 domain-containing protein [Gemmatimonadaceae bacterium]